MSTKHLRPIIHRVATTGKPVGIGVCATLHGSLSAYLKPIEKSSYVGANELICGEIGRFLGLPIPAGGIAFSGVRGSPAYYASVSFNHSPEELPPADTLEIARHKPDQMAAVVVFDALIANLDRHNKNLAYSPRFGGLLVYDHSHALLGETYGAGIERLNAMREKLCLNLDKATDPRYTRHCLGDHIKDASNLVKWIEFVREMPASWLERVIKTQGVGISSEERTAALDFLIYRKDNLRAIFQRNQHQFPNLQQTSLL
jgi:hypothetical protein